MMHGEKTENESSRNLEEFTRWLQSDKNLPQNIDKILLQRFLKVYDDNDLKKSQDLLKFHLRFRKSGPHVFLNRDILSEETQRASRILQFCPLPELTADNLKVSIIRVANDDASQFNYIEVVKMVLMMFDARYTMYDDYKNIIASGECFILDGKGINFWHFLKVARNISTVRLYMKYLQEAAPINIKQMHFYNCSKVFDRIFSLIRPLLKEELLEVMHFHTRGLESLHQLVAKEVLPIEYGGNLISINEHHKSFMKFCEDQRNYLTNEENWKIIE